MSAPQTRPVPHGGRRRIRALLLTAVRAIVALCLLTWLMKSGRIDVETLFALEPGPGELAAAAGAMLAVSLGFVALAVRLRLLLQAVEVEVGLGESLRVIVVGLLSTTFLPGYLGGDVVRATMLCRGLETGRRRTIGTVAVDRMLGLLALFALAALAAAVGTMTGTLDGLPLALRLTPWVAVIGAPIGLYAAIALTPRLVHRAPARWVEKIEPLTICLGALARRPGLALGALGLGMLNHALVILTFIAAGRLIGDPTSVGLHYLLDPLAMSLNALPISPGGLGVSESMFSYLYDVAGSAEGATIGVIGRLIQYVAYALAGGIGLLWSDNRLNPDWRSGTDEV